MATLLLFGIPFFPRLNLPLMKTFTLLGCWLLSIAVAPAQLLFETNLLERSAEVGESSVIAEFNFKNTGTESAEIGLIDSSCGCLKARSNQSSYLPGESGVIEAEFFVKGLSGTVEKSITVRTNSNPTPVRLAVRVNIPEILLIEPKMLSWEIGEDPTPKRVTFKVLRADPIHLLEVVPSRKEVTASLHTIEDGRHYEIELTPRSTSDTILGVVRIETDCEIREQQRQMAFFRVSRGD